ncbi:DUF6065 family protein [Trujillonella humicola]|uniref:DUF6065 family protein n=1 Tax=Trujillonella humicola TaxID=3383699 RepID=UPI0039067185
MDTNQSEAIATFFQVYPDAPLPRRASPGLNGSIPAKAEHYCEPLTSATGFGWHLFPPLEFALQWDGTAVYFRLPGQLDWELLEWTVLPGLDEHLARHAPYALPGHLVPFLTTGPDLPGIVQIWTGVMARTRPGWSLLVRPPANLPRHPGYDVLEGIIETDWWFGPLISNVRLCLTGHPILFHVRRPLFQVQPVPKFAYRAETLKAVESIRGVEQFTGREWDELGASLMMRNGPAARPGSYKTEVRRRTRGERHTSA